MRPILTLVTLSTLIFASLPAASAEEKASTVKDGNKVSIEYTLTLEDGSTADSNVGGEPLVYQHGGGQMIPAFETAVTDMALNEVKEFTLAPKDGYGEIREELRNEMDASLIPEEARVVGTQLMSADPQGNQRPVTVYAVNGDKVVMDYNHPLAGQSLHFKVKILNIE